MKHRYIVRTFVEAKTPQEALRLARKMNPHEVYFDTEIWKMSDYALKEKERKIGFKEK
jgi:hypothetical protein